MTNTIKGMEPYEFSHDQKITFEDEFAALISVKALVENDHAEFKKHLESVAVDQSGIYFWTMILDGRKYKIYIGRANSVKRRMLDYCREFSPHSPNDFKLRVFQQEMLKIDTNVKFHLNIKRCASSDCVSFENDAIKRYSPLLNVLKAHASSDELKMAFANYYISCFQNHLGGLKN